MFLIGLKRKRLLTSILSVSDRLLLIGISLILLSGLYEIIRVR